MEQPDETQPEELASNPVSINNINTEFIYIVIFYILVSVLGIGTLINLIYTSKWGQRLRIKYISQSYILNIFVNILLYLSIIGFPTIAIYVFTQLYYYKAINLFKY
jgi:hypothetical protein